MGGAGWGAPSEGCPWVPSVELLEDAPGEPPARDHKTSAVVVATLAAALRTVPIALAAVAPRLDGSRDAAAGEAATVGPVHECSTPSAGAVLLGIGGGPTPSPCGAAAGAAGPGTGSTGSGAGSDA